MPFKKHNNYKTIVKRDIKRRLIEISIRVDGYIYKNKPISVTEAEKLLDEIYGYRTKYNDIHIMQVTEKLTRCIKTIIEEITKKEPPIKKVAVFELYEGINFFVSAPINSKNEDSDIITNCNVEQRSYKTSKRNDTSSTEGAANPQIIHNNKTNSDVVPSSLPRYQTLNSKPKKTGNTQKKLKAPKINKPRVPKKTDSTKLPNTTNRRKKAANKSNNVVASNFKELSIPSTTFKTPLFYTKPNMNNDPQIDKVNKDTGIPTSRANNEKDYLIANKDLSAKNIDDLEVYNEFMVDDLSWVENIRYVREVQNDEFCVIPNTSIATFWDNFSLPDDWNELDIN